MLQRRAGQALHSCSWARVGVEEGRIFSQGLQFVPSNKEHQTRPGRRLLSQARSCRAAVGGILVCQTTAEMWLGCRKSLWWKKAW